MVCSGKLKLDTKGVEKEHRLYAFIDKEAIAVDATTPYVNRRHAMKYTKQERVNICRRIYEGELIRSEAMEVYDISAFCARDYTRLYRICNHLPPKEQEHRMPSVNWVPMKMVLTY